MAEAASTKSAKEKSVGGFERRPRELTRQPIGSGSEVRILALQRTVGNRAVNGLLSLSRGAEAERSHPGEPATNSQSNTLNHPPPFSIDAGQLTDLLGTGKLLPIDVQRQLSSTYGDDFSAVRIHDDLAADHLSKSFGAEAFSIGERIAFRRDRYSPATRVGRELIEHEAGHIVSSRNKEQAACSHRVQLSDDRIDDVAVEMVGLPFTLLSVQGTAPNQIPKGATVTIVDWKDLKRTATVEATIKVDKKDVKITLEVPKVVLTPAVPGASGVRRYKVGLGAQQAAVEKAIKGKEEHSAKLKAWEAEESSYKKNHDKWQKNENDLKAELERREKELAKKEETLSQMLVRETMYNRFDPIILQWVNYYNKLLKPKTDLDPNIVKSMLFRETRMGTFGEHLELPPYSWSDAKKHPARSRLNIQQAIDSYGDEQLLIIEDMAPEIFKKYKLDELKKLSKSRSMTNAEMVTWGGNALSNAIQEYNKVDPATNKNLMGTVGKELFMDYSYWIRTGIRALFWKYSITNDWPEAVRAFKGRPDPKKYPKDYADTQAYKKDVMSRVGSTSDVNVGNK